MPWKFYSMKSTFSRIGMWTENLNFDYQMLLLEVGRLISQKDGSLNKHKRNALHEKLKCEL